MARRRKRRGQGNKDSGTNNSGYKPRRDWQKIGFYIFSVTIVLAMVCALFAGLFQGF